MRQLSMAQDFHGKNCFPCCRGIRKNYIAISALSCRIGNVVMPDVIRTKRRYATYLLPLYVQDNSFLDFVNDELDPSGELGSIIPEFVQTMPALGQTAAVA